jgi:polyhydroxyalkanoate synthesis regulator phasin
MSLRPVRFQYKAHGPESPQQYGLVAEEVAEVAPDLVARNPDGQVETVFYDKVNAMLLNEVQKQHRLIEAQRHELDGLRERLAELENRVKTPASPPQ